MGRNPSAPPKAPLVARRWAIGMLKDEAYDASVSEIKNDLVRCLPGSVVYFPALTLHGTLAREHALVGYVFVGLTDEARVGRLQRSRYLDELVRTADRSQYELLTEAQLEEIRGRAKPPGLRPGAAVRVLAGECQGLTGTVTKISRAENSADVSIRLHSRSVTTTVSLHELERV